MAVQVGAGKDGLARQRAQYPSVTVFGWQQLHKIAHRGVIRRTTVAIGRCAAARKAFALRRDHFIPFPVHCGHARGNALFRLAVFFFFITQFFQINQSAFSPCSSCFWGGICAQKRHTFLRMCLHLRRTRGKRGFSAAWVVVPPQFLCGFKRKTPHKSSYRTSPFQIADCNSRLHYITNISMLQAFSQKAAGNFSAHQNGIDLDAHHRAAQQRRSG